MDVEREQPWIQGQMTTAILWSRAAGVEGNGFCNKLSCYQPMRSGRGGVLHDKAFRYFHGS